MANLEVETRLSGGEGRYRATLSPAWMGPFGLYGGALAALALRAAAAEARAALAADIAPIDDIRSDRIYRETVAGNVLEQFLRAAHAGYARG